MARASVFSVETVLTAGGLLFFFSSVSIAARTLYAVASVASGYRLLVAKNKVLAARADTAAAVEVKTNDFVALRISSLPTDATANIVNDKKALSVASRRFE